MYGSDIGKDLLVIELASVLAGPAVGMFFAELGARVIKIENRKGGGDVTRRWKVPTEDPDAPVSAYYHSVNWQKEVRMMDLSDVAERDELHTLVREADIVISNFRQASAARLGVDYEQLREINPRLIYGQITGFGEDSSLPAFDIVLQAETGFMSMTGEPDRPPVRMPVALIDILAAHQLKEGLLIALLQRERQGRGSYVSVSLRDAAVASLANQASNWLVAGHLPQRMGSRHPNIAPYGDIFITQDGQSIVLAVGSDQQFAALCRCLELPHLIDDPRFATNAERVRHRDDLNVALATAIRQQDSTDLVPALHQAGAPVGRIRTLAEVFADEEIEPLVLRDDPKKAYSGARVRTVVFRMR